jgi:hypothetical protein
MLYVLWLDIIHGQLLQIIVVTLGMVAAIKQQEGNDVNIAKAMQCN